MVSVRPAEARDNIDALLDRVERGEEVLIRNAQALGLPVPAP